MLHLDLEIRFKEVCNDRLLRLLSAHCPGALEAIWKAVTESTTRPARAPKVKFLRSSKYDRNIPDIEFALICEAPSLTEHDQKVICAYLSEYESLFSSIPLLCQNYGVGYEINITHIPVRYGIIHEISRQTITY